MRKTVGITIKKSDPVFDDLRWVLKARGAKEKYREQLQCLCVQVLDAVCTDGRRLHIAKCEGLQAFIPEGAWEVVVNTVSKIVLLQADVKFPDYTAVIPDLSHPHSTVQVFHGSSEACFRAARHGVALDHKYVEDAVGKERCELHLFDENNPAYIQSRNRTAIVMPLRLEMKGQ